MSAWHPLAGVQSTRRSAVFVALLLATLLIMVVFQATSSEMSTSAAPQGIVSFELAGTVAKAQAIIDSWNSLARQQAAFGLGLDYLYMPLYSTTIALACVWVADALHRRSPGGSGLGILLAWGLWLAALLDAMENAALLRMLFGSVVEPWPQMAFWCAALKFALILAGIAYALAGGIGLLVARLVRKG